MEKGVERDSAEAVDPRRMLAAVVDAAPVALCVIGADGRVLQCEGQPFAAIGLSPGLVEGVNIETLWSDHGTLCAAAGRAQMGESATATVVADDRALEIRFIPVAGADGKTAHTLVVASDVTNRYAELVEIAGREEFLQGVLDTLIDGVITIDELGLIRDFNPSAAAIFGYKPAEVIGKTVTMLMPDADRDRHDDYIRQYLKDGVSRAVGSRRELSGRRKDGTVFPMELSVSELKLGEHSHFTGVVRDITKRRAAERALRESEERYALAAKGANDGLWDWDLDSGTVYYSSRWKSMFGHGEDEVGNTPDDWLNRIHRDDAGRVRADIDAHLAGKTAAFQSEYRIRHKGGEILHMLARGVAVRRPDGTPYRMAGSQSDITEQKRAEARLIHDALHDPLTGLPNRTLLLERLGQTLERFRRTPDQGFAVIALNIDRFKLVNESLGHGAGDDLLLTISRRLENRLKPGDTLARLGGDMFAILLQETPDATAAEVAVKRMQRSLSQPFTMNGREFFTTVRVGIVQGKPGYQKADDILRDAELALSRAKRDGGKKISIFDPKLYSEAVGLLQTETDLRQAIENGGLTVFYQPIVALANGRIVGFEALARIEHPVRGIVAPSEFIGIAEETGLIVPLCQRVMSQACAQTAAWQKEFGLAGKLCVSVNLSARNVSDDGLFDLTEQVLADSGIPPGDLRVEITETLMMSNPELMAQTLTRLKSLGIGLALDDFGTGYSSFSHLRRFPLDTLKIDRSFVKRMLTEARDLELVRIIVMLSHTLGLNVIAEGVETAAHAESLFSLKCEYAQGFHYAAPLPAPEAGALLRD